MDKKTVAESEIEAQEVEASGDALIIADALYSVADAIREFTRAFNVVEEGDPQNDS